MTDQEREYIKDRHPIKTVAENLGLVFKGDLGKCFDHEDKHPSLVYMTQVNRFECKSCGIKGDVIDLVMRNKQLSFKDAIAYLEPSLSSLAGSYKNAKDYLSSRQIKDETLKKFNVRVEDNKVVIPLATGNKYRTFEGETRFTQDKGTTGTIFKTAPSTDIVLLCEGELDAIKLFQEVEIPAWSGTAGAATFRPEWKNEFTDIKKIYICYDNDPAGHEGTEKVIEVLGEDRCFRLKLPYGKDITEFFQAGGSKEEFTKLIAKAKSVKVSLIDLLRDDSGSSFSIPTGLHFVDDKAIFEAGNSYLIGGCEKSGKSALALNIAVNMINQGHKISYVNTEFTLTEFTSRLTAINKGIPYGSIDSTQREEYLASINAQLAYSGIGVNPIEFDIIHKKLIKETNDGSKVIFFDNVTTFSNNPPKGMEGWKEQARIMNELKDLAKDKNVIVFVVIHTKDVPLERTNTGKIKNIINTKNPRQIFDDSIVVMAKPTNANLYGGLRIASQFSGSILLWRPFLKFGDIFFNRTTLIIFESFRNSISGSTAEVVFKGEIPTFEVPYYSPGMDGFFED